MHCTATWVAPFLWRALPRTDAKRHLTAQAKQWQCSETLIIAAELEQFSSLLFITFTPLWWGNVVSPGTVYPWKPPLSHLISRLAAQWSQCTRNAPSIISLKNGGYLTENFEKHSSLKQSLSEVRRGADGREAGLFFGATWQQTPRKAASSSLQSPLFFFFFSLFLFSPPFPLLLRRFTLQQALQESSGSQQGDLHISITRGVKILEKVPVRGSQRQITIRGGEMMSSSSNLSCTLIVSLVGALK